MKQVKTVFLVLVVGLLAMSIAGCGEKKAKYPEKSIQLYVGAKAGGGTDVVVRRIAPLLEKSLGQPVVIVNKDGGSGHMCNLEVFASKPDGYTIGVITDFAMAGSLVLSDNLGYTKEDFNFIGAVDINTNVLYLSKDFPGEQTLNGFVQYAKAHPGKVTVGTTSAAQQMVLFSMAKSAGIEISPIQFKGGAVSFNNLLGGHIDACFAAPTFSQQAIANHCPMVAVASHEQFEPLADVPTFKEMGYDAINNTLSRVFYVPGDTPKEIVELLSNTLQEVTDNDEFKEFLNKTGVMYHFVGHTELTERFNRTYDSLAKFVNENPNFKK